jgi:hypothetical protein
MTGTIALFDPGIWHTAALQCIGNTITGFVDATQCAQINDATYPKGMAGLGTGWNKAQFDNLVIKKTRAQVVSVVRHAKEKESADVAFELRKAFQDRRIAALRGPLRLEIVGLDGRDLGTFSIAGNSTATMDFSKVSPGAYVVRIRTTGDGIAYQSIMIAR